MGKALDEIFGDLNKKAKAEIACKGLINYEYTRVPFTSPRMNYMTFGGLPTGRLYEFYGEEGGGKTTTALDIVANYQNMFPDRDVLYIDAENTLDPEWAMKLGVDISNIYLVKPESQSAEDIFELVVNSVDSGEAGLWVIDSLGSLLSKQEWEKEMEEKTYGGISMPLTKFSKKIQSLNKAHDCLGIGINQLRDKINSPYGGTTTPGGRAWKFFCSARIEFRKGSYFDEKGNALSRGAENPAGNFVMAHIEKTKIAPPSRKEGQYRIKYIEGIDYIADLIDVAVLKGIIEKKGAWFTVLDTETGEILKDKIQGQANLSEVLDNDMDLTQRVEQLVDIELNK